MKKILFIAVLLVGYLAIGQKYPSGIVTGPMTTTQINAISAPQEGRLIGNSTTETVWYYNGSAWVDTGVAIIPDGSITEAKLNTTTNASLDLADSSVQPADLSDYVTTNTTQTITSAKTFSNTIDFTSGINTVPIDFQGITSGSIRVGATTDDIFFFNMGNDAAIANFNFGNLTTSRIFTFPDTAGTIALTSDIPSLTTYLQSGDNVSELTNDAGYITDADVGGIVAEGTLSLSGAGGESTINHGLGYAPSASRINVQLSNIVGTYDVGVKNITSTSFDVVGVNAGSADVAWAIFGSDNATPMTGGEIVTSIDTQLGSTTWQGGGTSLPVDDTTALVQDPVDNTKLVRIDAGGLATATTRTITMPDADVNLGAISNGNKGDIVVSGTDLTIGVGAVDNTSIANGVDAVKIYTGEVSNTEFNYLNGVTSSIQAQLNSKTDNQTASEVPITDAGGYFTGTDVEAMGQEIGSDLADRPTSLGTGRTSPVQYSDIYGQTLANYNTDGAGSAGDLIIITDASPAEVVTTATIAMDGWKMYDDQTADAATITLSDCDPGETLTVYINRASAPTLAGTGLTFNQLPNTTAFASATQMMIIFEVAYDGTTIDYYYVER